MQRDVRVCEQIPDCGQNWEQPSVWKLDPTVCKSTDPQSMRHYSLSGSKMRVTALSLVRMLMLNFKNPRLCISVYSSVTPVSPPSFFHYLLVSQ